VCARAVDDDPINLRVMTRMLHKLGQDDLRTAETGTDALISIEEIDFDIIFMDGTFFYIYIISI
jgi:CheY-like chemotaxis protein